MDLLVESKWMVKLINCLFLKSFLKLSMTLKTATKARRQRQQRWSEVAGGNKRCAQHENFELRCLCRTANSVTSWQLHSREKTREFLKTGFLKTVAEIWQGPFSKTVQQIGPLGAHKFWKSLDNILAHRSCCPEIDGLKYRVRVHTEHFPPHFTIIFDSLNFPNM